MTHTYKGPIPALDLSLQAFDRTVRGIRVVGSWWLDEQGRKMPRPCLVLLHPLRRLRAGHTTPIVIHLKDIWKWDPDTLDAMPGEKRDGGPIWASRVIRGWLNDGLLPGSPNNPADRLAVYDAIIDSLRDLRFMPPLPPRKSAHTLGEIQMVNETTGKVLRDGEIRL